MSHTYATTIGGVRKTHTITRDDEDLVGHISFWAPNSEVPGRTPEVTRARLADAHGVAVRRVEEAQARRDFYAAALKYFDNERIVAAALKAKKAIEREDAQRAEVLAKELSAIYRCTPYNRDPWGAVARHILSTTEKTD